MTTWYKVAWIPPLFAAVDRIAPGRGHAEDGTIGDLAHATGVSGHNPDDTPGVRAERQDADSKPEVRAADVDSLGTWPPGLSMERVVQAVLHGPPAERDRLIYVIYMRRIWRKDNGWRQETYGGDDPHDKHAHFSGDPASDDDGRPWTCIENLGDDVALKDDILGDQTKSADHPTARNGNEALSDLYALRLVLIGQKTLEQAGYASNSPLAKLLAMAASGPPVPDITALAAALAPLLTDHLGVEVGEDALVAALQSDAGQAALVQAANAAEDS